MTITLGGEDCEYFWCPDYRKTSVISKILSDFY
jgi:hypothetical protein